MDGAEWSIFWVHMFYCLSKIYILFYLTDSWFIYSYSQLFLYCKYWKLYSIHCSAPFFSHIYCGSQLKNRASGFVFLSSCFSLYLITQQTGSIWWTKQSTIEQYTYQNNLHQLHVLKSDRLQSSFSLVSEMPYSVLSKIKIKKLR